VCEREEGKRGVAEWYGCWLEFCEGGVNGREIEGKWLSVGFRRNREREEERTQQWREGKWCGTGEFPAEKREEEGRRRLAREDEGKKKKGEECGGRRREGENSGGGRRWFGSGVRGRVGGGVKRERKER
ncbi:hypothetical protein HAX54_049669, partial [Datura stramonium]|nr:hypothetical protein [Datura stramonium]